MSTAVSPVTLDDLAKLKQATLFTDEDVAALRRAHEILAPRVGELLDVWYGFVGSHDFLLAHFSNEDGPDGRYLAAVRERFARWVLETTRAGYDERWLAYQEEIGHRHYTGKNETDGITGSTDVVSFRYVVALVYPIYATVRPFLEEDCDDPVEVERMHQAWLKSLLIQVALWSRPYVREGAF